MGVGIVHPPAFSALKLKTWAPAPETGGRARWVAKRGPRKAPGVFPFAPRGAPHLLSPAPARGSFPVFQPSRRLPRRTLVWRRWGADSAGVFVGAYLGGGAPQNW